ncbi:MAG: ankyrin repeat domain-containing protein, partial [Candidatus Algichlamydia australiensis]|nr:ankyrin repeat domain-containing protein [Chlamydiales bacterium]
RLTEEFIPLDVEEGSIQEATEKTIFGELLSKTLGVAAAKFSRTATEKDRFAEVLRVFELDSTPSAKVLEALLELKDLKNPLIYLADNLEEHTNKVPNYQILLELIQTGGDILSVGAEGSLLLHIVLYDIRNYKGNLPEGELTFTKELILALVAKGVDINVSNDRGYTAAHFAAAAKNPDFLRFLVQYTDVDLKSTAKDGVTPLMAAGQNGKKENENYLLDVLAKDQLTPEEELEYKHVLEVYGLTGHPSIAVLEVLKEAQPSLVDLLYRLDENRDGVPNLRIFKELVEAGVDVHISDKNGRNPLHLLVSFASLLDIKECISVATLLINKGLDVNTADSQGATIAHIAASKPLELLKFLGTRVDINFDEATNLGWTPLHYATYNGMAANVKYLLETGVRKNPLNNESQPPIDFVNGPNWSNADEKEEVRRLLNK